MTRWVASLSVVLVARLASAAVCESQRHAFELDPSPGTELDVGDCYKRAGDAAQAQRWYRDADRRFAIAGNAEGREYARQRLAALAVPPPAPAAHQCRGWKIALWTSIVTGAASAGLWAYGSHEVSDARSQLCAGGAYSFDPSCGQVLRLSDAQVRSLNDRGDRGQIDANIGELGVLIAGTVALVSAYELYRHRETPRHEVVVTPVVGHGTGGAVASWSW